MESGPIGLDLDVEPDLSNAAPFLAAALVTGGAVTVPGWPSTTAGRRRAPRPAGPDGRARGARRHRAHRRGRRRRGRPRRRPPRRRRTHPILAALCALATTPSHLRGIAHLRGHETDRLHALATELGALGAEVVEHPDGLDIRPRRLAGGTFASYDDHRMAQAGALLGLVVDGIVVDDVATTAKTMPDFVERWRALVASGAGR